jgi:hypothetical protein
MINRWETTTQKLDLGSVFIAAGPAHPFIDLWPVHSVGLIESALKLLHHFWPLVALPGQHCRSLS